MMKSPDGLNGLHQTVHAAFMMPCSDLDTPYHSFDEDAISGLSPGRVGQVLYPYWKRDMENEVIDRERTLELLECMRIKFPRSIALLQWASWVAFCQEIPSTTSA